MSDNICLICGAESLNKQKQVDLSGVPVVNGQYVCHGCKVDHLQDKAIINDSAYYVMVDPKAYNKAVADSIICLPKGIFAGDVICVNERILDLVTERLLNKADRRELDSLHSEARKIKRKIERLSTDLALEEALLAETDMQIQLIKRQNMFKIAQAVKA